MQNTVEEVIKALQQPNYCLICDVTLPSQTNAEQHYISIRHNKKVKALFNNDLEKQKKDNSTEVIKKVQTSVQTVTKAEVNAPQKEKQKTLCHLCNVYFETNLTKQHYQESEHKKKEEAFCNVCKILTMSKEQLWQHLHGAKHASKLKESGLPVVNVDYGPFDSKLPQSLTKLMLTEFCQLCNVKCPTLKHALSHYQSAKHRSSVLKVERQSEFGGFMEQAQDILAGAIKSGAAEKLLGSILQSSSGAGQHQQQQGYAHQNAAQNEKEAIVVQTSKPANQPLLKVIDYHCYACKIDVHVETKDDHRTGFPHTELARLKAHMVSLGITEEYWVRKGKTVLCTLCNVKMSSVVDVTDHFNNAIHHGNYRSWCRKLNPNKQLSESDTKLFYCKICDKHLDCTTESVRHYQAASHQKKCKLYCVLCKVRNPTEDLLKLHNTTILHIENEKKHGIANQEDVKKIMSIPGRSLNQMPDSIETNKPDKYTNANYENYELDDSFATLDSTDHNILKGKVFRELQKLIETLFLSKKVPYEVALRYLEKCNIELEMIRKQYERKKPQETTDYSSGPGSGVQEEVKKDIHEENVQKIQVKRLNDQELLSEDDYYSFSSDTVLPSDTDTVFNLIDLSDHLPAQEDETVSEETQSNDVNWTDSCDNFDVTESNLSNNGDKEALTAERNIDGDNNEENSQKIETSNIENNYLSLSLDNVANFETLAQEITLLKTQLEKKYPNEENLEKNVITEIERLIKIINNDDIPPAVLLEYLQDINDEFKFQVFSNYITPRGKEKVNDGTGDGCKTEVLYRYSKEDLVALRTAETFTTSLMDLRLRMSINQARIWNKKCNDLDLD